MKIDLVHPKIPGSFIIRDIEILKEMGIKVHTWSIQHSWDFFPLIISRLRDKHRWNRPIIFWHGGYAAYIWSCLPRILRGQVGVIIGGSDVTVMGKARKWVKGALQISRTVSFVASHLFINAIRNSLPIPRYVHISPTWVNANYYHPNTKISQTAILLGPINRENRIEHKGLDRLHSLVSTNPDWSFIVTGVKNGIWESPAPNIKVYPMLPELDIARLLSQSKIILSLSRREGMPNALIEGMLSGCIPVVTQDVPSIVEAIENIGVVIQENINLDSVNGDETLIRKRALRLFSKEQRKSMFKRMFANFGQVGLT